MKHLTFDDRIFIETSLINQFSFSDIAKSLHCSYSTISNEVKKRLFKRPASQVINNECVLQFSCLKYRAFCKNCSRSILCKACQKNCNTLCSDFTTVCPKLKRAPFVCNGCPDKAVCRFEHCIYSAKTAHDQYKNTLSESRSGVALNKPQFYELDNIISNGLSKGQFLYHIHSSSNLNVAISTIYNYFNKGYFSAKSIDLPRKVKFKARKAKDCHDYKKQSIVLIGRKYEDFIEFCKFGEHSIVQIDTVEGIRGGKAILTLHFCESNVMVGYLIPNISSYSVSNVFYHIKTEFERANLEYGKIFDVVLTDNGREFTNPKCIENNNFNEQVVHLFFCHPRSPFEKGKIEKNHVHIRDILSKGSSFEDLSQKDVDLMFCHINSINRKSLGGKCPYDLFVDKFGFDVAKIFGLTKIPALDVIQNKLLTKLFTHE